MSKKKMDKKEDNGKKKKQKKSEELEKIRAQLARALADYDNLSKRIEKERFEYERVIKSKIITKMLQVFDMLDEVQKHINDTGLDIAMNTFRSILDEENVEEVKVKSGDMFDQDLHEAVEIGHDEEKEDGVILELLQTGWKFKDGNVIRYAKVKVNKKGDK